jgi:hypothetical protein
MGISFLSEDSTLWAWAGSEDKSLLVLGHRVVPSLLQRSLYAAASKNSEVNTASA